jgi:hypothetical protein
MHLATAIAITLLLYAVLVAAGVRVLRALRRRRCPWPLAIAAAAALLLLVDAAVFIFNQQRRLQHLDPPPPNVRREITNERWLGPLLLGRTVQDWGKGGSVQRVYRWRTGEIPLGAALPTAIAITIASVLVRRRERRAAAHAPAPGPAPSNPT